MGFVYEDENRWAAAFIDDASGEIVYIVGHIEEDENGLRTLLFDVCDARRDYELVSVISFEQMLFSYERDLKAVPIKTNKKYKATFSATIEVPVEMHAISPIVFEGYIYDGYETEEEIAQHYAYDKLMDHLSEFDGQVVDFQPEAISEIE